MLGVCALFYFASLAVSQQPSLASDNDAVETGDRSPLPITVESSSEQTESNDESEINSIAVDTSRADAPGTDSRVIAMPKPQTNTAAEDTNQTSTDHNTFTVIAYRAILFDSIESEDAIQTSLIRGSTVSLIEQQGEWLKVTTADALQTGFVHASQVEAN